LVVVPAVIGAGRLDATRTGRDDGAIAIMVALLSVVLFGFAALVVDIGNAYDVRAESQTAADSAARAGVTFLAAHAGQVTTTELADTVKDYVAKNGGPTSWTGCQDSGGLPNNADLTDPTDDCITFQATGGTYQVRVHLPVRQVAATLGGIFGVSSIRVAPLAVAQSGDTPSPPCGPCNPALDQNGDPVSPADLPDEVQKWLPDPNTTPAGTVVDGCPATPGLFDALVIKAPLQCTDTAAGGVYVFNDTDLTIDSGALLKMKGVTLVFYGKGSLFTNGTLILTDTPAGTPPVAIDPLPPEYPGVALIFAQYPNPPTTKAPLRKFELGAGFQISGSVYALDGTTWSTDAGDCPPPVPPALPACQVDPGDLAVTNTNFANHIVPTVAPQQVLPPQPPHLVK
jgi:hypothetical protein